MSDDADFPPQTQPRPGEEGAMEPGPRSEMRDWRGSRLLEGKVVLVTGGDSGIGRAVCACFAKEGADVAIAYLTEDEDAKATAQLVEGEDRRALLLPGDLQDESHCREIVRRTAAELGSLDVLICHHGTQTQVEQPEDLDTQTWEGTFRTNVTSFHWLVTEALGQGVASIVMTGSVNGLRGNKGLIDYAASKGAIHVYAQSLAQALVDRGIRVNVVAPGPVWTPLIPATFPEGKVEQFGGQVPMQRAAHPDEIAPSYLFFAAERMGSYYTGEVLAPIGGETLPG
jgi:NAD(P)-dependent dehydrogenase (short-subunit alcohol dehydrogenase family)